MGDVHKTVMVWNEELADIVGSYKELMGIWPDEPLDGDAVDHLCCVIQAKVNLLEGNITEEEYFSFGPPFHGYSVLSRKGREEMTWVEKREK